MAFLEDQKKEEIPLSEIFTKIGLDKQNWDFHQTVEDLDEYNTPALCAFERDENGVFQQDQRLETE